MSNAVKFTSGGKINASVRLLKEDKKKVTLEFAITDTGIGIPEDKIATIFEKFQQEIIVFPNLLINFIFYKYNSCHYEK